MKPSISERIVKPKDCAFAFGVPLSKEEFDRSRESSPNPRDSTVNRPDFRTFASHCPGGWKQYYEEFVGYFEAVEPEMVKLGVEIIREVTLQRLGELFRNDKYSVVILFTHWDENRLEFSDAAADVIRVVREVPEDFDGVFDLCVCHPISLTTSLRKLRPNCLVRYTEKEALPSVWLYFYRALFQYLKTCNVTYLQALDDVISGFLEKARKHTVKQLRSLFEEYLLKTGQMETIALGGRKDKLIDKANNESFSKQISQAGRSANHLIVITITMACLLFAGAPLLSLYFGANSKILIPAASGGVLVLLFLIVKLLRRLWIEKIVIEVSLNVLSNLPPEEAAKFIKDLYWNFVRQSDELKKK